MSHRLKLSTVLLAASLITPPMALAERVRVGSFEIDQTEVTVQKFASFAARTGLVTAAERAGGGFEWGAGWQWGEGWNFRNPVGRKAMPDEPAVHISWYEAGSYCADAGGRLPNREEWTSAAYTEQRSVPAQGFLQGQTYRYPVGDTPDGMNINLTAHVRVGTTVPGVNGLYDICLLYTSPSPRDS